ncbi:unnamed protein product [Closterium sp. NIES-53]
MAPSPLAMAPRDLPPLTAAPVPCCAMVGEGVTRGGSSCPRALQSHAQLRPRPPPPPPPPPWGWRGEGEETWRFRGRQEGICSTRSPTFLLPPLAAGAAEGGRGPAAPAPPPFSSISLLRSSRSSVSRPSVHVPPVATVRAAPVARVSAASAVASYLLSSHSPASSSSLALCECL